MPKAPITRFCNLSVEPNTTNTENGLFAPNLNQIEINQIRTNLPNNMNGCIVYNTSTGQLNFGVNGNFTPAGAGDVTGPGEATIGHVPIFGNIGGTTLEDSGLPVAAIVEGDANPNTVTINQAAIFSDVNGRHIINSVATFNPAPAQPILDAALEIDGFEPSNTTELGNIGYLQFDNAGTGGILVDALVGMHLVINEVAVDDAQVCLIMGPGFGTASSSVSALIELQTTTGALLFSRMTTTQRDAMPQQRDGMVIYNTTTDKFNFRENGTWQEHAEGTITSITAGTGLDGGTITTSGTIALADTTVTPGDYNNANITIDGQGRITAATNGDAGTVTSITAGAGLTGGTITTSGTIGLDDTGVVAGTYTYSTIQVNTSGQITGASDGIPPVVAINEGDGIFVTGTTTPTVGLTTTGVTAGSYTNANITVDDRGRISVASNGSASGDVTGPGSSVNNNVVTFSGTTGKIVQDSGIASANLYYAGHPTTLVDTFGTTDNFFAGTNIATAATIGACIAVGSQILENAAPTVEFSVAVGQQILTNAPGTNNIGIGLQVQRSTTNISASNNVSVGNNTLDTNTTGGNNTVVGTFATQFISGSNNVAMGYESMLGTSGANSASQSVAIGARSQLTVGTCLGSVAIGYESQLNATNSTFNVTVGHRSGQNLTNCGGNILIGNSAGSQTTTGSNNTIVGSSSFSTNITGNNTVIIGSSAGKGSTLDNNICIGYKADLGGAYTNAVAIGALSTVNISNAIVLGSGCNVGIGISNPTYALHMGSGSGLTPLIYVAASGTIAPPAVANDGVYMVIAGRPYFTSGNGNTGYLVTTITTGTAPTAGLTTLNGTTGRVVSTTLVLADSKIHVTRHNGTGTPPFLNQGQISIGSIVPGVSFTIYSSNALDTEGVSWTMQP